MNVDEFLDGPRGRRLCLEFLDAEPGRAREEWPSDWTNDALAAGRLALPVVRAGVAAAVAATDLARAALDQRGFLSALLESVTFARYWQDPDGADRILARPRFAEVLRPVAEAFCGIADDLSTAPDPSTQVTIQWMIRDEDWADTSAPSTTGAADALSAWRTAFTDGETSLRRTDRYPLGRSSSDWWSTPPRSAALLRTSQPRPADDPVPTGLTMVEDSLGIEAARTRRVHLHPDLRIFTVDRPADWRHLVATYPLEATYSRRHNWWLATGREGRWLLPDWSAVAQDFDGVHVSIAGYLSTSGLPLTLDGPASTLLAGWNPGDTYWLTDVLLDCDAPELWRELDVHDVPRWYHDRSATTG